MYTLATHVLWLQKNIFLFEESSPVWFYRPVSQWQTGETRNKEKSGKLLDNILRATAHQNEGPTLPLVWLFSLSAKETSQNTVFLQ